MPRRVGLPGAAELFRPTGDAGENSTPAAATEPASSGRVRHEEKITVYVSIDELAALEQTRLNLRVQHGIGVDRGRIVRTAIGLALADFAARGADSDLFRGLEQS